jgi:hypothetical protein
MICIGVSADFKEAPGAAYNNLGESREEVEGHDEDTAEQDSPFEEMDREAVEVSEEKGTNVSVGWLESHPK